MFFLVSASAIILPTAFGLKFERWEHDGLKLVIFGNLLSSSPAPPPPLKPQKIRILEKWKKILEILSFYKCVNFLPLPTNNPEN